MIHRIDQVEGLPVIGRTYLVPCVMSKLDDVWRPVIGEPHTDPVYFPAVGRHFHYDVRFCDAWLLADMVDDHDAPGDPEDLRRLLAATAIVFQSSYVRDRAVRPLPCLRRMPVFPTVFYRPAGVTDPNDALPVMERDYADARLRPGCPKCPHRGMPLNGLPVDGQGRVVCPGHGLRFNLRTGRLSPRVTGGASC